LNIFRTGSAVIVGIGDTEENHVRVVVVDGFAGKPFWTHVEAGLCTNKTIRAFHTEATFTVIIRGAWAPEVLCGFGFRKFGTIVFHDVTTDPRLSSSFRTYFCSRRTFIGAAYGKHGYGYEE
jgi:hypothetical protein